MADINIVSVVSGSKDYHVMMVLTEPAVVDGEPTHIPIGEAVVPIPHGTEMADVKARIIDAAQRVMDAHNDAHDKKVDLNEIVFPPIT